MLAVCADCVVGGTTGAWSGAIALEDEDGEVRMKSRRCVNSYIAFLQSASLTCFDKTPSDCVDIVGRLGGPVSIFSLGICTGRIGQTEDCNMQRQRGIGDCLVHIHALCASGSDIPRLMVKGNSGIRKWRLGNTSSTESD